MCILIYIKIQSDQPRVTQNAFKKLKFYLCSDDDLVNKSKIWFFKKHFVLFLVDHLEF